MKEEKLLKANIDWDKITRLEVISETGREYVVREIEIESPYEGRSIQDEGRTLKLFISHKEKKC